MNRRTFIGALASAAAATKLIKRDCAQASLPIVDDDPEPIVRSYPPLGAIDLDDLAKWQAWHFVRELRKEDGFRYEP